MSNPIDSVNISDIGLEDFFDETRVLRFFFVFDLDKLEKFYIFAHLENDNASFIFFFFFFCSF